MIVRTGDVGKVVMPPNPEELDRKARVDSLRRSRGILERTTMERVQRTQAKLREVTSATEDATIGMLDGLGNGGAVGQPFPGLRDVLVGGIGGHDDDHAVLLRLFVRRA